MNASPVAYRELLVAARRRSTLWIRCGAGSVGALILTFGMLANAASGGRIGGDGVFFYLLMVTSLVVGIAGMLLTADAISSETRDGTLGLLFLTDLRGFDVVSGKLAAAGLNAMGALIAVLPLLALTVLLGGVTGGDVWRCALALLNLLWVALCLGLVTSVQTSDSQRALLAVLVLGFFLFVVLPLGNRLLGPRLSGPEFPWLWGLSPVSALIAAQDSNFKISSRPYWQSLMLSHGLGWIFVLVAARTVPNVWRRDAPSTMRATGARPSGPPASVANPVAALTRPSLRERWLAWGIVLVALLSTLILAGPLPHILWGRSGIWSFDPATWALQALFAWKCCSFFHQLRSGAGEQLLTTPVNELQLLGGAWAGARQVVEVPLITLIALSLILAVLRLVSEGGSFLTPVGVLLFVFYSTACLGVNLVAFAWLSARFGLLSRSALQAWGLCLAVVLLPQFFLVCIPDLLLGAVVLTWARTSVLSNVRGWLTGEYRSPPLKMNYRPAALVRPKNSRWLGSSSRQ